MSGVYKDEISDEWFYPKNSYILSETDDKGMIIYANDLFCEVAGFSHEELLGEPHNIVRHPDMPRVAFKGLWDDIQSKGFWTGFVKNRRKDGGYYWVFATALRSVNKDGKTTYLSIRTAPSREDVAKCEKLYAELRENE
jgi:PAS domain S-box-containing protein